MGDFSREAYDNHREEYPELYPPPPPKKTVWGRTKRAIHWAENSRGLKRTLLAILFLFGCYTAWLGWNWRLV